MTELHPIRETYEGLRDSVENTEARAAWNDRDRREALLAETYRTLKDDPRYTEAHKAGQMWAAYDKQSEVIRAASEKARELLEREARGHEMMSVPRPKGENIFNLSTERLIASQNEAGRIVRKVQRLQDAPGPFKMNTADVLKEEYAKGIEAGGVEGVAICKGALMAADELGVPDEFLDELRTPEQRELLDKAWRARRAAFSIPNRVSEPPLRRPQDGRPGSGAGSLFIPRDRPGGARHPKRNLSWIQR
jgi:hypothetical protein